MSRAYYNEHDPKAAAWLRELIKGGHIADGIVDERSIADVQPSDLAGYTQCHFFAGIGGWSLALRIAGWPDDWAVWTGSCPCQPFSVAGKGAGIADARHLWPEFARLIGECLPANVFGEQVASAAGRLWLAGVRADLEGMGYAVGAADLCSAGVGSPNIRQRIYWMAQPQGEGWSGVEPQCTQGLSERAWVGSDSADRGVAKSQHDGLDRAQGVEAEQSGNRPHNGLPVGSNNGVCEPSRMADTDQQGSQGRRSGEYQPGTAPGQIAVSSISGGLADARHPERRPRAEPCDVEGGKLLRPEGKEMPVELRERSEVGRLEHPEQPGLEGQPRHEHDRNQPRWVGADEAGSTAAPGVACFWSPAELLPCTDGKARRVEPGSFPLAHGIPGRVGLLRGYGNAINPWLAAEFIQACEEAVTPAS
jgi:DNA (cytosine-5)-methyltransferase 1